MSMECSLYGQISHSKLDELQSILTGFIGYPGIPFCRHEVAFIPTIETPYSQNRNDDVVLWLQSSVYDHGRLIPVNERDWKLIQKAQPEPPKVGFKLANHRMINRSSFVGEIDFMNMLGYSFDFEFVTKGFMFRFGDISIKVYRVYKVF